MLALDRGANALLHGAHRFDPVARRWHGEATSRPVEAMMLQDAVAWLQRESGHRLRTPIGVIGPRDAGAEQLAIAEAVGVGLGRMGLALVCGGRQGVMEAVCRGSASQGGFSIGLLPEAEPDLANPYVTVPIATGIGEARNALVARAALCLVVIGDSYGTLSEVALGLQFGKRVFGLAGAAQVKGTRACSSADEALDAVARVALALPDDG
ncbi:MAG TPA: hypothetical protein VHM01_11075 [Alphaproteobacteria bacterium]|nr:hypothetical protein [Alphaproteobacteria bacterium]